MLWCSVALLALFASVQGRAVNISNTWVLPEEGFPVFYRYFRDRISWYEADAVCQFHHANLVTVDTTAQYDAVRAYLKELDISSAVWVGLIRSNPDGDFTWTDYRGLSGEGYWSSAPDARSAPLCAAADPAADYRWEARACGGPTVASFICELPVPQWALGNEGCMVRALPALTILYLPESAAVQLTADCGLAGVKRVQCTGNVKREDLLKELSCEEEITTTASIVTTTNTGIASSTIDAVFTDQDTTTDITTEESLTTEHEDDVNQSMSTSSSTTQNNLHTEYKLPGKLINSNQYNRINLEKNLDLNMNNLQSNYIPKIANGDNYLTNEQLEKIEDEKHMQHKMLHEEIARLGNVENIFTQPTDHFVPPLVMAKAKLSDDMTVLSLQEKHAQQIAEQHFLKQNNRLLEQNEYDFNRYIIKTTTEGPKPTTPEKTLLPEINKPKDNLKKDKLKTMPKKYYDPKFKIQKLDLKPISVDKIGKQFPNDPELTTKASKTTPMVQTDDSTLDLTITLKDIPNDLRKEQLQFYNYTSDVSKLEVLSNNTGNNDTEIKLIDVEATEETITKDVPKKHFNDKIQNITMNHEVIKITIISEAHSTVPPTIFEVTTKIPSTQQTAIENVESMTNDTQGDKINHFNLSSTQIIAHTTQPYVESELPKIISKITTNSVLKTENTESVPTTTTNETPQLTTRLPSNNNDSSQNLTEPTSMPTTDTDHEIKLDYSADIHETDDTNTNSTDAIDDLNSPLLSGANEPLPRPNRSRRPQPPPIRNKFNPFRILG